LYTSLTLLYTSHLHVGHICCLVHPSSTHVAFHFSSFTHLHTHTHTHLGWFTFTHTHTSHTVLFSHVWVHLHFLGSSHTLSHHFTSTLPLRLPFRAFYASCTYLVLARRTPRHFHTFFTHFACLRTFILYCVHAHRTHAPPFGHASRTLPRARITSRTSYILRLCVHAYATLATRCPRLVHVAVAYAHLCAFTTRLYTPHVHGLRARAHCYTRTHAFSPVCSGLHTGLTAFWTVCGCAYLTHISFTFCCPTFTFTRDPHLVTHTRTPRRTSHASFHISFAAYTHSRLTAFTRFGSRLPRTRTLAFSNHTDRCLLWTFLLHTHVPYSHHTVVWIHTHTFGPYTFSYSHFTHI